MLKTIKSFFKKDKQKKEAECIYINGIKVELTNERLKKWENEEEELEKELEKLKAKNEAWKSDFYKLVEARNNARDLEKSGKPEAALEVYLTSLKISENSENLQYGNFQSDIKRVLIIYSKLKRFEDLKYFLEEKIEKYGASEDWIKRLNSVNKKLNK